MVEEPSELRRHMSEQRDRIDQSLNQLEENLEQAADWKTYVRRHPWWTLGGGLAAGLLLSGVAKSSHAIAGGSQVQRQAGMLGEKIDGLFGAALGLASDAVENAVMGAFPILQSKYRRSA